MTNREFLNNIVAGKITNDEIEKATTLLKAMDAKNEARKAKPSKTAIANEPIKQAIVNALEGKGVQTAAEVGATLDITTQKASALLRQLTEDGILTVSEVKVPKKGKVKGYAIKA